ARSTCSAAAFTCSSRRGAELAASVCAAKVDEPSNLASPASASNRPSNHDMVCRAFWGTCMSIDNTFRLGRTHTDFAKRYAIACTATVLLSLAIGSAALADDSVPTIELPKADGVSLHFQSTLLPQGYLPFQPGASDPASGNGVSTETWTMTGYFGARLWQGGEFYVNPETFQGFLLRDFSPSQVAIAASVGN